MPTARKTGGITVTTTGRTSHKQRTLLAASVSVVVALLAVPSALAASGLQANFKVHFPRGHPASNAPCPADELCGVGRVNGYGKSTITIVDEAFSEIPDSPCLSVEWTLAIDPVDGSGELVLDSAGTFCQPGESGDSHAGPSSYGHPGTFSLAYTVDGDASSGAFAGAQGTGTVRFESAGGIGVWTVRGSLNRAG